MNFVGKILTGLILLFSIAFLMIAVVIFQTHKNWREIALGNKKQIDSLTQANRALQNEIQIGKDRHQMETVARRFALAALESKAIQQAQELAQSTQNLAKSQETVGIMTTQIEGTSRQVATILDENGKLRTNLRETQLHRDQSFEEVVELTDKLNQQQGTLLTLQEREQELVASNGRMRDVLRRHNLNEFEPAEAAVLQVDGVITAVGEKDLLEISLGSDEGLKKGHTLEVFRGNTYLGRVLVRETWPDRSVVQIIPEFRKGIIRKGDRVATKLG